MYYLLPVVFPDCFIILCESHPEILNSKIIPIWPNRNKFSKNNELEIKLIVIVK